jgi:hypothetical protein
VPAFTRDGIENLRQIIADERAAGRGHPPSRRNSPPCGAHRMLTSIGGFWRLDPLARKEPPKRVLPQFRCRSMNDAA